MTTLVILEDGHWLRIDDGGIVGRGNDVLEALPSDEDEIVIGVVAARDAVILNLDLPGLSDAQATAAAKLAIGEHSLSAPELLHVAAGPADEGGQRDVVAVESSKIASRLQALAAVGLDPDRLLAAPLLLPRPEIGFVRATLGLECIVRGQGTGFLDDPALTAAIVGAASVEPVDRLTLEAAIIDAVGAPGPDLRFGIFAKRKPWSIDVARLRRFAVMALVLGLLILLTAIVAIVRTNMTASNLEHQNVANAAAVLPPGTVVTDPALQAEARLTAMRGAGGGLGPLASAFATAVNATPNVELGSMVFDGEGGLRATVRGAAAADLSAVEARLAAAGLRADPGPIVANQGRPYRDITVRRP
jgi:general secretion pathway protein L